MARYVMATCTSHADETTVVVGLATLSGGPHVVRVTPLGGPAPDAIAREVVVDVDPPRRAEDGTWWMGVTFEDARRPALFPVFDGTLEVRPRTGRSPVEATLAGQVTVPGRALGELVGHAVRHVADRTVEAVLTALCHLAVDDAHDHDGATPRDAPAC